VNVKSATPTHAFTCLAAGGGAVRLDSEMGGLDLRNYYKAKSCEIRDEVNRALR
jgi:hypothetical protein